MKKNKVGLIITSLFIIASVIEIGVAISFYMFTNIDYNKYATDIKELVK